MATPVALSCATSALPSSSSSTGQGHGQGQGQGQGRGPVSPPPFIELLYFHKAIRAELERLHQDALAVEHGSEREVRALVDRYFFLLSIYNHHSKVEDEVLFAALDLRVKNVASAYLLEHQVASNLFDQMSAHLTAALKEKGNVSAHLRRDIIGCAEAIQTTLNQHLSKEEEHVFPLLFRHFNHEEQAALVWQFICSFPVNLMEKFLPWLASSLSLEEKNQMVACLQEIVPREELLQKVVSTWLEGGAMATELRGPGSMSLLSICSESFWELVQESSNGRMEDSSALYCQDDGSPEIVNDPNDGTEEMDSVEDDCQKEAGGLQGCVKLPINELLYWHNAIRKELQKFVDEAHKFEFSDSVSPSALASFIEQLQFLADVCIFHSAAEDNVVFPAVGLKVKRPVSYAARHAEEEQQFDDARKLLADFQFAGLGSPRACAIHKRLCAQAEHIVETVKQHLLDEEVEILPLARKHCSVEEQRLMLYESLRVMPLKFLERALPWLVAVLTEDEARDMLCNMHLAAPDTDKALVTLFSGWACKGQLSSCIKARPFRCLSTCSAHPCSKMPDSTIAELKNPVDRLGKSSLVDDVQTLGQTFERPVKRARNERTEERGDLIFSCGNAALQEGTGKPMVKHMCCAPELGMSPILGTGAARSIGSACRSVLHDGLQGQSSGSLGSSLFGWGSTRGTVSNGPRPKPIDHIFQFHKAIKKDLEYLDIESAKLSDCDDEFLRQFSGRFTFLQGLYRAHSNAEDDIVFPALEAKDGLHNISHSYSIDHKQEEQLFAEISDVFSELLALHSKTKMELGVEREWAREGNIRSDVGKRRAVASKLQRMFKSVRVSLDQHVSREEVALWPLFDVHFTIEEQDNIIGRIIGTTGAEVLQAMIPWVTTALTEEEQTTMLSTWRQATRNTMFDKWLSAWWKESPDSVPESISSPSDKDAFPPSGTSESLQMVADYLELTNQETKGSLEPHDEEASTDCKCSEIPESIGARPERAGDGDRPEYASDGWRSVSSFDNKETDSEKFRPGWQSIFRMNQKEVEAAIRKVSSDSSLDPRQKSYLIQNLMTSRWIVAQQKLTQSEADKGLDSVGDVPGRVRSFHNEDAGVYGCEHYKRNCKLRAACCGSLFTCRFCHDKVSDHSMDRHATMEVMCMKCLEIQPVSQYCITPSCNGYRMARYFCSICKFFDDDSRDIYHCPSCNLCRVGKGLGIDFFHCMTCNSCMSKSLTSHKCREKGLESNCPICHDFLFTSNTPVKALRCNHFMHSACFQAYTCSNYTCPICSKSLGDMSVYFGMLDALLAAERLPDEYRSRRQEILCNDCEQKGTARFHWLYHKCGTCGSYNTRAI